MLVDQNRVLRTGLAETLVRRFNTKCMGDVSTVLAIQVTHDRKNEMLTILLA